MRFIFLLIYITILGFGCTKNENLTEINYFDIVGQYVGEWQKCTIENTIINCETESEDRIRIFIYNENKIVTIINSSSKNDTLAFQSKEIENSITTFLFEEKSNKNFYYLIFTPERKTIKFCNQISNDSTFIETCFEGQKI